MYAKDVGVGSKSFLLQLKREHPFFFNYIMCKEYVYGQNKNGYFLLESITESEQQMTKALWRTFEERVIELKGSEAIEFQIFNLKRYIDFHRNKTAKRMRYNLDYLMIDSSLHKGEWKGFSYDVRDKEDANFHWLTPAMSAAEWRKILNTMLCILKKQYRESKAKEKKPKPRKPRRVPFKQSMYANVQ